MLEILQNLNWILFFHIAGLIIGLGAVTVIDLMGFISRKSKIWTTTTIQAHNVTKLLIWLGTILLIATWPLLYQNNIESNIKSILLIIMILNGSFLSFYVSPKLNKLKHKKILLPNSLQIKIAISMIISFISWWLFVLITTLTLN